jgi:high affinity sulfate transporter 1
MNASKSTDASFQVAKGSRSPHLLFFQGLLPFNKSRFGPDLIAGITLTAIGIPEVMGYTKIIGMPVITGLYTLLLPVALFALFGSSRHLVVSADSATAAIVASEFASLSLVAYTPTYVAMAALVALVAAALLLAASVLRLGFLADFLSRTVLVGFLSGVGIQVACAQLHGMLGVEKGGHGLIGELLFTFQHLPQFDLTSLVISLVVLVMIIGPKIFQSRIPGALLAVIAMIGASAYFHWDNKGIPVVGAVPSGLPRLGLPNVAWHDVLMVLPVAASCFIVILAQSAATSRAYALRYREPFNENVDLVGLALANAAAGLSSAFVVAGSPTKTAIVDEAGGRSQLSHLTAAAMVLLVLLFLTRPLSFLPNAVLAAIVFTIGVKLIDYRGLAEIRRLKPKEFALALVTAATVIFVGVEQGIVIAVVLSLLQHVRRSYQPNTGVVVHDLSDRWRTEEATPGTMLEPGLVLFWFGADLFYANTSRFTEQVHWLIDKSPSPVRWFAIDASAITDVDFSAGEALMELQQELAAAGVVLAMARVQAGTRKDLEQLGLVRQIGPNHIFESRHACLQAYRAEIGSPN